MDKLTIGHGRFDAYSKEDLMCQLLDTMRKNERLHEMLTHMRQVFTERNIPYKDNS